MKSTDKDLTLKFRTSVLFRQLGFLPEIAAQITSRSYQEQYAREQLSDYDVLGIRFEPDLRVRKIAAECKSGERKALEELLKLKGIVAAFGLERGYFVKTRVHRNAREVAASINISTFDDSELKVLLTTAFGIDLDVAITEEERRHAATEILNSAVQHRFPRLHVYMRYEFWNLEAHRNLQNLIWFLRNVGPSLKDTDENDRHLFCRVVLLLSLSVLELAGTVLATNQGEPDRGFAVCIFGGARERREREVLFDQVNKLFGAKDGPALQFEPEYLPQLSELVARMIRSARVSSHIPFFLDAALDRFFRKISHTDPTKFDTVTRKLAQDLCELASKEASASVSLAKEIMAL